MCGTKELIIFFVEMNILQPLYAMSVCDYRMCFEKCYSLYDQDTRNLHQVTALRIPEYIEIGFEDVMIIVYVLARYDRR